ncbi:hypothetical protein [Brachybacterium rhamnosum]|uniref:hypothetical protein n=1 Tax=Brachybacterium rhamnosum TaxID=173361 RepID=UPI0031D44790
MGLLAGVNWGGPALTHLLRDVVFTSATPAQSTAIGVGTSLLSALVWVVGILAIIHYVGGVQLRARPRRRSSSIDC